MVNKIRFQLLCVVVAIMCIANSTVLSFPKHRGTNSRVSVLLILAMKARDAGKMDRAMLFWKQAKSLRHGIAMPKWLSVPVTTTPAIRLSDERAIKIIASLPYKLAKPIMKDLLEKNPNRNIVRKLFVKKAKLANDIQQVNRNQSVVIPDKIPSVKQKVSIWKIIFLIIVVLLAIWQGYKVVFEITRDDKLPSQIDNDIIE